MVFLNSKTILKLTCIIGAILFVGFVIVDTQRQKEVIVVGLSKADVFEHLISDPNILRVWPALLESRYISRENVSDISMLEDAERLSISGLGVSLYIELDDGIVTKVTVSPVTPQDIRVQLSKKSIEELIDVLSHLIVEGTVYDVEALTRRNPNQGRAVVDTTANSDMRTDEEINWLFFYDSWFFLEEESGRHFELIFSGDELQSIDRL